MRIRYIAVLACCLLATACADRSSLPSDATAVPIEPQAVVACPSPAAIEAMIGAVFPSGGDRSSALSRFKQVTKLHARGDVASARSHALSLITFILGKYEAGRLIGGQSAATQVKLTQLLNAILCSVGLPATFGPGSLGPDGAVAFIYPNTPDTVVTTETEWAGVAIPAASVTQPTIVTIQRLPDNPGPLFTQLDQYPLYYQFHSSSGLPFTNDLVVGVCQASNVAPPDPTRLRIAHNVGTTAVITPLAAVSFLDCADAPLASSNSTWGFDLARAGTRVGKGLLAVILPAPLHAAPVFATGGVGGTVREFSPFGAVDTLGTITAVAPDEYQGLINGPADRIPSVVLTTPSGRPLAGVPVTFAITSGGGSLAGGNAVTNAAGVATSGVWTLGPIRACTYVSATATMPAGSGLSGNPVRFVGCARLD